MTLAKNNHNCVTIRIAPRSMQSLQVAKSQLQEVDCFIIAMQTFLLHQLQISYTSLPAKNHSLILPHIFSSASDCTQRLLSYCLTHFRIVFAQWNRSCANTYGAWSAAGRWCKQNHSLRRIPLLIQRELCNRPSVYMSARWLGEN